MKKFELHKDNFFEIENSIGLLIKKVTELSDTSSMETLIDYFNREYTWDGMFTINDVLDRLNKGDILFILSYNHMDIGYIWYTEIDEKTCKSYNLYVTKIINRPNDSAYWFYNRVSKIMIEKYDKIVCDAEDWNKRVHDIFYQTGFKKV